MAAALVAGGYSVALETQPIGSPAELRAIAIGDLDMQWAAVHARAQTLAQLPRLVAVVGTDEATVRDLTNDELAFRVRPDETIELAQRGPDGLRALLRLPATAPAVSLVMGTHLSATGDRLSFSEVVPISGGIGEGALAIVWKPTAASVFTHLAARTATSVRVGDDVLAIGGAVPADAPTVAIPLDDAGSVTLAVPATRMRRGLATVLWGAAAVVALLGTLGALVWPRRRRAAVAGVPVAPVPRAPILQPRAASSSNSGRVRLPLLAEGTQRLGRYEPVSLLGTGGSASVFLARALGDEGFETRVALKVLRADLTSDARFRDMFLDEARLAAHIDHPNVVQILDLGREGDELYIAMEHVDGDDLESLLFYQRHDGRQIPVPLALAILRHVCDGLHAAHTAVGADGRALSLVHRDVKPGNVLISRNGEVKVADFGIATATQQLHHSDLGETKGTAQFMAPEQRTGGTVDARADVFGAAAIGYELVTGLALDLDLQRLLAKGLDGWPHLEPLARARAEAPPELQAILFGALSFDAAARPPTCAALEAQLAAVMDARGWSVSNREVATWLRAELALRTATSTPIDPDGVTDVTTPDSSPR